MSNYLLPLFGETAEKLADNGYRPLPIVSGQKNPVPTDWPNYVYTEIDRTVYHNSGIGIICGTVIGVDIDVRDAQLANQCRHLAEEMLGPAPTRIGQPPKVLMVYQVDGEPFSKLSTSGYRLPEDHPEAKSHRIEVLAKGQQFVAFGTHPDTHQPYCWNGQGDPRTVPVGLLTAVTQTALQAFLEKAEQLLAMRGRRSGRLTEADEAHRSHRPSSSLSAQDPVLLRAALGFIPNNDLEWDDWIRIGYSIMGALGEAGKQDWLNWSARCAKDNPVVTADVWTRFRPKSLGAGTIYHLAKINGWVRPTRNVARGASDIVPERAAASAQEASIFETDSDIPPVEAYLEEQRHELVVALNLPEPFSKSGPVTVKDFFAYMPTHTYLFAPTGELWPSSSVNARCDRPIGTDGQPATTKVPRKAKGGEVKFEDIPIAPSAWLDKNHPVEQMTWVPGEPQIIRDRLVNGGGWIERVGCASFNLYRAPTLIHGEGFMAEKWREHLKSLYGAYSDHIEKWLAHRVQRPGEKINHALVLGGNQGIGKDSILEPLKYAVGPWNFVEISPSHLLGRFNGFVKSVVLRVSEARDLGDIDRYAFYDHTKIYTAAPPDVIRCDEKNLREHAVMNVCGVIITSNHKQDGIYLPADDRRHYVAWSELSREEFPLQYWTELWTWYREGGIGHVAAYLANLDLSDFDPKAPPPKTDAFWEIVNANRASEDAEIADILDIMGKPPAFTIGMLEVKADEDFQEFLRDRRNRRAIPHRLETVGYVPVRNPTADDGLWRVSQKRKVVYADRKLSVVNRIAAASAVQAGAWWVKPKDGDGAWEYPHSSRPS